MTRVAVDFTLNSRGKKLVHFANNSEWQLLNGVCNVAEFTRCSPTGKFSEIDFVFVCNFDDVFESCGLSINHPVWDSDHAILTLQWNDVCNC